MGVDGGCHIQGENAVAAVRNATNGGYAELSGPPVCPEMNQTEKARLESSACDEKPAHETLESHVDEDNTVIIIVIVSACAVVILCCIVVFSLRHKKSKRELTAAE